MMQKLLGGSAAMLAAGLVTAFGFLWLGIALQFALLPLLGPVWAWVVPGVLYLLGAAGFLVFALRRTGTTGDDDGPERPTGEGMAAGGLGREIRRGLKEEVRHRPLQAVSLAALGGALLGASPELRRALTDVVRELAGEEGDADDAP